MYSRRDLAQDFRNLGVRPGDVVMLHASVRSVGTVAGGPNEIHLALKDALTETGTLLMYAGCPRFFDEVGRGNLTPDEEREVLDKLPPFDAQTAPAAQDHGILVEMFRTYPGSLVNNHVTRFVVWGQRAGWLIGEQPWDFALGRGSALDRLMEADGKILLLGSDHDQVTFLHYVEHLVDPERRKIARFQVPIVENGQRVWRWMQEVDSSAAPDGLFREIVDGFLQETENRGGRVGDALSHLFRARELFDYARLRL